MKHLETDSLALIPGPVEFEEPLFSFEVQDMVEVPAADIAETLDDVFGRRTAEGDDWFDHEWMWSEGERFIIVGFTVFAALERPVWGGSELELSCRMGDLLGFWGAIRERHEGVGLHDDECRIYKPDTFRSEWET